MRFVDKNDVKLVRRIDKKLRGTLNIILPKFGPVASHMRPVRDVFYEI